MHELPLLSGYFARCGGVECEDDGDLMVKETASGEDGGEIFGVAGLAGAELDPVAVLVAVGTGAGVPL